jgi:hypothetical protein
MPDSRSRHSSKRAPNRRPLGRRGLKLSARTASNPKKGKGLHSQRQREVDKMRSLKSYGFTGSHTVKAPIKQIVDDTLSVNEYSGA